MVLEKPKFLVLDNDARWSSQVLRRVVRSSENAEDYPVLDARSDTLQSWVSQKWRMVVMDADRATRDQDPLEAVATWRLLEEELSLLRNPILVVSERLPVGQASLALSMGADHYGRKSDNAAEIQGIIRETFSRNRRTRERIALQKADEALLILDPVKIDLEPDPEENKLSA